MKNILICPLDWGMGHASRVRQIAHTLHQEGHNIIIASSSDLHKVFDESVCSKRICFSSLPIKYSSKYTFLAILLQTPFILLQFLSDHYRLGRLIKKHKIDIVISDNRFGAWSKRVISIYITHQLTIKVPEKLSILSKLLSRIHRLIASQYDKVWIPDVDGELSGDLSSFSNMQSVRFIGILSMLNTCEPIKPEGVPEGEFYAVIFSGPEPQRTILEKKLKAQLASYNLNFVIAGGKVSEHQKNQIDANISSYNYLLPGEVKYILSNCKGVICRSGYSTLMDLATLNKGAIVIPTPGQTEQEYLSNYHNKKGWFKALKQSEISKLDLSLIPDQRNFIVINEKSKVLLKSAIDELISLPSSQQKQK